MAGLVLLLGAASVAVGASLPLPGLRGIDWTHEAHASRDLIGWLAQLSGGRSDLLPVGVLFVLPVFAARWFMLRIRSSKTPEEVWEELHGAGLSRRLARSAQEVAIVVSVALALGAGLALYLRHAVLPDANLSASFVPDAVFAIVAASVAYLLLVRAIDAAALVDGAVAVAFCGAAATFGRALVSVLAPEASAFGAMDPNMARALLVSAIAVPLVIVVLKAQWKFEVLRTARRGSIPAVMPFRVVPEGTLRVTIGMFLWVVTAAMVAVALANHTAFDVPHTWDWLVFPVQPALIALAFHHLATGRLGLETERIADVLRRGDMIIPGLRPGEPTRAYLHYSFQRMLAVAALVAGAISTIVMAAFWIGGATALECLQGLAWVWTIGAAGAALQQGVEDRAERRHVATSRLLPRVRWSPARAQFVLLCVTAAIDRSLAPEEKFESLALGKRTKTLHKVDRTALLRWLSDVEAKREDRRALLDLAGRAIEDYPKDIDMQRAIYAQCADIAYADRKLKARESWFLRYLAHGLRLPADDRKRIDAVILSKNRH